MKSVLTLISGHVFDVRMRLIRFRRSVLIPLISGHVFGRWRHDRKGTKTMVLIPLISGHVSTLNESGISRRGHVLIPLISGHVRTIADVLGLSPWGLNPLISGHVFDRPRHYL